MSQPFPLPACCPRLSDCCPLPCLPAGAVFVAAGFDPQRLSPYDFAVCGIEAPASIQRSVAKRQSEFLAGRLCAREAMHRLDGRVRVPALGDDRAPVWPSDLCGSITHSTGRAAAIVAPRTAWRGLGMDMEQMLSVERATRLCGEILTPAETSRLREGYEALQITLTFSAKESLFKALYPLMGVRFYFEDAELLEWSTDGRARLRLLTDLSDDWARGSELDAQFGLHDGHLLSLVTVPLGA